MVTRAVLELRLVIEAISKNSSTIHRLAARCPARSWAGGSTTLVS